MHYILQIILKPTARTLILIRIRFKFFYIDSFVYLIHRHQKTKNRKPNPGRRTVRTLSFARFFCFL